MNSNNNQKSSSSKNEDASNNKPIIPTTASAELSSSYQDDIVARLVQNTESELKSLKTDVNQYIDILKSGSSENSKSPKSPCKNRECLKREEDSTLEEDEYYNILRKYISEKDELEKLKKDSKDKLPSRSKASTPRTPKSSRNIDQNTVVTKWREVKKPVSINQRKNLDIQKKNISCKKCSTEKLCQKKNIQRKKPKETYSFPLEDISEEDRSRSTSRETISRNISPSEHSRQKSEKEDKSISSSRETTSGNVSVSEHRHPKSEKNKNVQTDFESSPLLNSTFNYSQIPQNTPNSTLSKSETIIESPEKQEIISEKPKIKETNLICKESCEVLEVFESFYSGKKKQLSVQTLPAVDIRRPLVTQKMPDIVIQPSYIATDQEKTIKYDNVKYLEFTYKDDNQPKEIPKSLDSIVQTEELPEELNTPEKITPFKHEVSNNLIPEEDTNKIEEQTEKTLDDSQQKNITIREELNLNIDDIPSVRTLKEIQYYLEQRCSLIRKRLDDESKLKPGECVSLRWKLCQPLRSQAISTITEEEVKSDSTPVPKFAVPNIIYDKISTENAPQSVIYDTSKLMPSANIKSKTIEKKTSSEKVTDNYLFDKATQYSLDSIKSKLQSEKEINATKNAEMINKIPVPTRKLILHAITNQLSIPSVSKSNKDAEIQTSDLQNKVKETGTQFSPQNSVKKCLDVTDTLDEIEIRSTNLEPTVKESATQSSPEKKIEKQKSIEQSATQTINLQPIIKDVKECAIQCAERKKLMGKAKIQTVDLQPIVKEITESSTQFSPKIEKQESPKVVTFKESSTQKNVSPKKIMKTVGLGVTENELKPTESQDKCVSCNLNEFIDPNEIQQTTNLQPNKLASSTDTCAVFNSAKNINIDHYRRSRSPERSTTKSTFKRDTSSDSSSIKINKLKCKRLQQKYRKNSTPIASSSTSTTENNSEEISLSEGEVRLPCECSTSIGEIHLCHYANNIRKKVRTLKQNSDEIVNEISSGTDNNVSYKYKYYDNWVTYYVTKSNKSVSSGEIGTHSNLSSITSISPSD